MFQSKNFEHQHAKKHFKITNKKAKNTHYKRVHSCMTVLKRIIEPKPFQLADF